MTDLDPFLHPIPDKFLRDPETRGFFEYLVRWCFQAFNRTGGASDSVGDTDTAELYPWQIYKRTSDRDFFSVSSNHTTYGDEVVEATSNVTISLNPEPDELETVVIKRNTTAGTVTISGNSKNVDGATTASLLYNYETITVVYSITTGEWIII